MDIQQQLDELLEKKGVTPPHLTKAEFEEKFFWKLQAALPGVMEETVRKISREIADEEFARIGRRELCRHALNKSEKHCSRPADCFSCPNYKPLPGWRRWLRQPKTFDILFIAMVTLSFIGAMLQPQVSRLVLAAWFVTMIVVAWRSHVLQKMLNKK